jgi:hypothetical protein
LVATSVISDQQSASSSTSPEKTKFLPSPHTKGKRTTGGSNEQKKEGIMGAAAITHSPRPLPRLSRSDNGRKIERRRRYRRVSHIGEEEEEEEEGSVRLYRYLMLLVLFEFGWCSCVKGKAASARLCCRT